MHTLSRVIYVQSLHESQALFYETQLTSAKNYKVYISKDRFFFSIKWKIFFSPSYNSAYL